MTSTKKNINKIKAEVKDITHNVAHSIDETSLKLKAKAQDKLADIKAKTHQIKSALTPDKSGQVTLEDIKTDAKNLIGKVSLKTEQTIEEAKHKTHNVVSDMKSKTQSILHKTSEKIHDLGDRFNT